MESTPTMFNYKTHADNGSMFNTPPTYAIYICKLVLEWLKNEVGGLAGMKKLNEKKAGPALRFPRPARSSSRAPSPKRTAP